ncbi:hypothetical protein FAES_3265 [Fibrella aestuarina BUZ 2]|uniref:Uncharacterized protein n=1 Tax=Fibrella aestuarina BUZ 2 TaxID=1166018 RepID=I0KAX1_9BACT|nr:hypothetical protein [Fibrella aestuarina]CCH01274.1 hypothetical protein FAES_3265 [Fibrella aestuarina BUZ 2]
MISTNTNNVSVTAQCSVFTVDGDSYFGTAHYLVAGQHIIVLGHHVETNSDWEGDEANKDEPLFEALLKEVTTLKRPIVGVLPASRVDFGQ